MTRPRIPVAGPWITEREVAAVAEATRTAWYENAGRYQAEFTRLFAETVGRRHAIELPSCTSAIHLALAALGVGPGDEVVVADLTWIASAAPIEYVGATAVFADVDETTWCLSVETLDACLTPRTRAVIVVDLYGSMPGWDAILDLARARGIAVIEDAAESLGSTWGGRPAGSFGDASVFSFHGSKTLTTGEGGMLVTDREDVYERALFLRDHGRRPGDVSFENTEVAFKYKMSAMQAALGLAQLERLDELVARKREIFGWYAAALEGCPVTLNPEPAGTTNSCWLTTAFLDRDVPTDKTELAARLDRAGIDTRIVFHPLSSLPAYAGRPAATAARARNRVAYDLSPRGINLPSAAGVSVDDVMYVAEQVRGALEAYASPRMPGIRT